MAGRSMRTRGKIKCNLLAGHGYRCVAHGRRGHGRSEQPSKGNDMETHADDLAALLEHLDLFGAVLVGHSTGGGEVARYVGRHGTKRLAKAVLVGAVPPLMLETEANPGGLPISAFDDIRTGVRTDRSQFFKDLGAPFYGANREGATVSQGVRDTFWAQGMLAGMPAAYECIKQFSETDFTEDLKKFDIPTLVVHGDDDQIVPIGAAGMLSAEIIKGARLEVYPGAPHAPRRRIRTSSTPICSPLSKSRRQASWLRIRTTNAPEEHNLRRGIVKKALSIAGEWPELTALSTRPRFVAPGVPPCSESAFMKIVRPFVALATLVTLAACGGGGGGSVPLPSGGSSSPTTAPVGSPATPSVTATATARATSAASASPIATATAAVTAAATTAPAGSSIAAPTAPPDAAGYTNVVPAVPAGTACRTGQTYDVYVQSGPTDISTTGSLEVFTVFEPDSLCGGKTYPLIFNGSGFGGARTSTAGSFEQFTGAGYGVISVDEAGEGSDGGKIRVMDPDQEGVMLMAAMNWAQAKLTWLSYGPTNDGLDAHEPIYGSDGGSYGGMYQFMLVNIDQRHRIRAMAPQITPADLNFSLFPGGAIKTLWDSELFAIGQTAGNGTSRLQYDPYVNNGFVNDFATDSEDPSFHDFFGYHSADYFCNGATIATNGGPGTAPALPPNGPPKINALIYIGVRDTLFDFNNGYNNYKCLQRGGGDVRLLSYQTGHNALGTVPDPYVTLFYPQNDDEDSRCGTLSEATAELAWFNQYLKGQSGAASMIPQNPCISLNDGDGVTMPQIPTYANGINMTPYTIASQTLTAGSSPDLAPTSIAIGSPAGPNGDVIAGIPHASIDVASVAGGLNTGVPVVYIGLGVLHASNPAVIDLVDNQVMPLRGMGHFDVDMIGGGIRMAAGDQLEFLIYGNETQFAATGNVNVAAPAVVPVTVGGTVYVPDDGPLPSNI